MQTMNNNFYKIKSFQKDWAEIKHDRSEKEHIVCFIVRSKK